MQLQMDFEVAARAAGSTSGTLPSAALYCALLRALRALAEVPALAAMLDDEQRPAKAGLTTVHACIEALLAQASWRHGAGGCTCWRQPAAPTRWAALAPPPPQLPHRPSARRCPPPSRR